MGMKLSPLRSNTTWTRAEKLKVRTLYLTKGWATGEIALELQREARQVTALVNRQGWAKKRREMDERAIVEAEDQTKARTAEFIESVDARSEEMVEKGFDLAERAGDAKDFVDAARGTQIFVNLKRQAAGMDQQQVGGVTVNLSQIFGGPVGPAEPRRVEPVPPIAVEEPEAKPDLDFA